MNFNLTDQFVRDYEEQRRWIEEREGVEEVLPPGLIEEVERLRGRVAELEQSAEVREGQARVAVARVRTLEEDLRRMAEARIDPAEIAGRAEEFGKLRALYHAQSKALDQIKQAHAVELERQEGAIRQLKGELALRRRELAEQASRAPAGDRRQMTRHWDEKVAELRRQIRADVDAELDRITHLPLRMRLAALIFDALILWAFAHFWGEAWTGWASPWIFEGALAVFSLRALASPGRMLLGISPRSIGLDLLPTGPASPVRRFFCWSLHYTPLLVVAHLAASDPPTVAATAHLWGWAARPFEAGPGPWTIVAGLFRPSAVTPAVVGLSMALAWTSVLLISLLLSPWVHPANPYLWNTTLVEWMGRVGFERFPRPRMPEDG